MLERSLRVSLRVQPRSLFPPVWLCPAIHRQLSSTPHICKPVNSRSRKKRISEFVAHSSRFQEPDGSHVHQQLDVNASLDKGALQVAIDCKDLDAAFDALENILRANPHAVKETYAYAQLLHHLIRSAASKPRPKAVKEAQRRELFRDHVKKIRMHYVSRVLPGDPKITGSILGAMRDLGDIDGALNFWEWARQQRSAIRPEGFSSHELRKRAPSELSPDYTDLRVYGIALPILARSGRSLDETEAIYQEGVRRYAYGFNEYHLSPTAWLQNPDKPTTVPGTSTSLVAGLMASRFIQGEVSPGYLCIDTLLRLHPTQIPVQIQAQLSPERPLTEQVQTFCMFLRAGNRHGPAYTSSLLSDLSTRARLEQELETKIRVLETMFNILRLSYASGMHLNISQLNLLLFSISDTLPRTIQGAAQSAAVNMIVDLLSMFGAGGVTTDESTFRQIKHADHANSERLLTALTISLQPVPDNIDNTTLDTFLTSYANLGLGKSLMSFWVAYRQQLQQTEPNVSTIPWQKLSEALSYSATIAGHRSNAMGTTPKKIYADHRDFLEAELKLAGFEDFKPVLMEALLNAFDEAMEKLSSSQGEDGTIIQYCETVRDLIQPFKEAIITHSGHSLENWPITRVSVLPSFEIPSDWQAELYNELVLGPQKPSAATEATHSGHYTEDLEAALKTSSAEVLPKVGPEYSEELRHESITGIPLAELRYRNWCDMNHVLLEAQAFEDILGGQIDQAIETGQGVPRLRSFSHVVNREQRAKAGEEQWKMHLQVREAVSPFVQDKQQWRERIIALRKGLEPPSDIGEVL